MRVKAVYLALGVNLNGDKELLGLWVAQTEGAKFWLQGRHRTQNGGVQDTSLPAWMASRAFLRRFASVFPKTAVQLCIVHRVRYSLNFVGWKLRKTVATDLCTIYTAATVEDTEIRLAEFDFVEADCWLTAENLMLAACAIGLGSCVIGSCVAALNLTGVKAELGIPAEFSVVAPIIVGVPSGETAATSRKDPLILAWKQ